MQLKLKDRILKQQIVKIKATVSCSDWRVDFPDENNEDVTLNVGMYVCDAE